MFHDMEFGWMGISWIFWIILIAVIVYFVIKITNNGPPNPGSFENAQDILKKRYAKGELTKQQFEKMKNELE